MKKAIGYISYPHGLDGKVKVVPMVPKNEFEEFVENGQIKIDNQRQEMITVAVFAYTGKVFICNIKGVNNIDEAKKITKHEIFVELPEDDDYINPELLINFDVFIFSKKDKKYGKVIDYGNYGAGDLLEIKTIRGKTEFYLCNKTYILNIDKDNKKITIKPNDE